MRRHLRFLALGLLGLPALASFGLPGPAVANRSPSYVALGDSYTAGPLIPVQQDDPYGCLRSNHNYPHLVARSRHMVLRDVSCSGATTDDMTETQGVSPGSNPPQFDSLTPTTTMVTVGIGGNDIGFGEILKYCSTPLPLGTPCQDRYVVGGIDELSARILNTAPKIAAVIAGIRSRSPVARIFVVGYPTILPDSGPGCWPQLPVTEGDVPYLRARAKQLNQMLADTARANGATYVDTYTASIGHDACQLPLLRWVEPMVPASPAAPVHPNIIGMKNTAAALLAAMSR